jgi:hypothetical protein
MLVRAVYPESVPASLLVACSCRLQSLCNNQLWKLVVSVSSAERVFESKGSLALGRKLPAMCTPSKLHLARSFEQSVNEKTANSGSALQAV